MHQSLCSSDVRPEVKQALSRTGGPAMGSWRRGCERVDALRAGGGEVGDILIGVGAESTITP